jgi:hypothetical protein
LPHPCQENDSDWLSRIPKEQYHDERAQSPSVQISTRPGRYLVEKPIAEHAYHAQRSNVIATQNWNREIERKREIRAASAIPSVLELHFCLGATLPWRSEWQHLEAAPDRRYGARVIQSGPAKLPTVPHCRYGEKTP